MLFAVPTTGDGNHVRRYSQALEQWPWPSFTRPEALLGTRQDQPRYLDAWGAMTYYL